jgi:hypothetical protein
MLSKIEAHKERVLKLEVLSRVIASRETRSSIKVAEPQSLINDVVERGAGSPLTAFHGSQ